MKKAFSLLEIIIGILIIGLISSFAIPKLMDTKDFASATTLKRDIFSIISSAQTYNLANTDFKIEEAIQINDKIWSLSEDGKLADKTNCVEISFDSDESKIIVSPNTTDSEVCIKLYEDFKDEKTYEM